ncbi:hypothetical protein D3C85_1566490 [compost metagenome]
MQGKAKFLPNLKRSSPGADSDRATPGRTTKEGGLRVAGAQPGHPLWLKPRRACDRSRLLQDGFIFLRPVSRICVPKIEYGDLQKNMAAHGDVDSEWRSSTR